MSVDGRPALRAGGLGRIGPMHEHLPLRPVRASARVRPSASLRDAVYSTRTSLCALGELCADRFWDKIFLRALGDSVARAFRDAS